MKKFIRNLFSGYLLIIFLLFIEVALLLIFQFKMDDIVVTVFNLDKADVKVTLIVAAAYILFRIIGYVMAFIIFFKILNKAENPEFKIPWLFSFL